jgi:hypothetical protein
MIYSLTRDPCQNIVVSSTENRSGEPRSYVYPRARKPHTTGGMITANRDRSRHVAHFRWAPSSTYQTGCFYLPLSSPMFFLLYFSLSPHIPKKKKHERKRKLNTREEKKNSNQFIPLLLHQRRKIKHSKRAACPPGFFSPLLFLVAPRGAYLPADCLFRYRYIILVQTAPGEEERKRKRHRPCRFC